MPAWGLKKWDRVKTKDGVCTIVRAKKARPYGPDEKIQIEMEIEDEKRIVTTTVDATTRFEVIKGR